jgi:hypothetical protein
VMMVSSRQCDFHWCVASFEGQGDAHQGHGRRNASSRFFGAGFQERS